MRALTVGTLLSLLTYSSSGQNCPFQIVAGPNTLGDGGPALSAFLSAPRGLSTDAAGNLYIADTHNHRIRKVALDGSIVTIAGIGSAGFSGDAGPALAAALNAPEAVIAAPDGSLYISDTGNHRVRKIAADGTISTIAGTGHPGINGDSGPATASELNGPAGLALDSSGALYIADANNNRVRRLSINGTIDTIAGVTYNKTFSNCCALGDGGLAINAELQGPRAVAVAADGTVYIADTLNYSVRKVAPNGIITTAAGVSGQQPGNIPPYPGPATLPLNSPSGLLLLQDGSVLIADFQIVQLSADGKTQTLFSSFGAYAIAPDHQGGIYDVRSTEDQIYRIAQAGATPQPFAGANHAGVGPDGGPAAGAVLNSPMGSSVGPDGSLYVADLANQRIVKLTNGIVHKVASAQGAVGVSVDASGNIFVADITAGLVRKTATDGSTQTVAGGGTAAPPLTQGSAEVPASSVTFISGYRLAGIVVHPNGNVFVAVLRTLTGGGIYLLRITPAGSLKTAFTTVLPGTLPFYTQYSGLGIDSTGNILFNVGTLVRFDGDGNAVGGTIINPTSNWASIAGGPAGVIYIADTLGRIKQISASGQISTIYDRDLDQYQGTARGVAASLPFTPSMNLAVDPQGNLFVADTNLNTVRELPAGSCALSPQPLVSTIIAAPPLPSNQTGNLPSPFAPGEIVTLYGSGLGPASGVTATHDSTNFFPTAAAGVQVFFEGVPAPILYAGANQVNTIIPFSMYGYSTVRAELQYDGVLSDAYTLQMAPTAPALFTFTVGRITQPIVVNPDGSLNSSSTPAPAGGYVTLYMTGLGLTSPSGQDGHLASTPLPAPVQPVTVNPNSGCTLLYAGDAPGIVEGFSQVNLQLPKTPISTFVVMTFGTVSLSVYIASK